MLVLVISVAQIPWQPASESIPHNWMYNQHIPLVMNPTPAWLFQPVVLTMTSISAPFFQNNIVDQYSKGAI